MDVTTALEARRSVRAFTDEPVPVEQVRAILDRARWAPSGGNVQPWHVHVVMDQARDAVVEMALQALADGTADPGEEYPVYPPSLHEPYRTRRFVLGEQMYDLLGITREDKAGRLTRFQENYRFFGAPVGMFFAIDRRMGHGQWGHLGMFLQSVALAATEEGLGTCFQEAWAMLRGNLARHLDLPDEHVVWCGMALGHVDTDHPVNRLRSERAPVDEFTTFHGLEG